MYSNIIALIALDLDMTDVTHGVDGHWVGTCTLAGGTVH
jgi:hypothetical protein